MCWIFAYNWKENSIELLVEWLRKLEYRWYDSAWVMWVNSKWEVFLEKAIWKVSNLAAKVEKKLDKKDNFTCWIAHTRWATHGKVTLENTHPHHSENNRFYVVHNWIIENYMSLKEELEKKYSFYWQTDTEVIAKLLEKLFDWDIVSTVEKVTKKLVRAYSIAVVDSQNPSVLIGAKLWSPMVVWVGESGIFLSSDINALWKVATEFTTLDDNETVIIKDWKYNIYSLAWEKINKETEAITDNMWLADKWSFETFTEKEINEVPQVLKNALKWIINFETKTINNETLEELNSLEPKFVGFLAANQITSDDWLELKGHSH